MLNIRQFLHVSTPDAPHPLALLRGAARSAPTSEMSNSAARSYHP